MLQRSNVPSNKVHHVIVDQFLAFSKKDMIRFSENFRDNFINETLQTSEDIPHNLIKIMDIYRDNPKDINDLFVLLTGHDFNTLIESSFYELRNS